MAFGPRWDWLVLAGMTLAGVLIRFGFGRWYRGAAK
jgi:uncharacterized membrane protein